VLMDETSVSRLARILELVDLTTKASYLLTIRWRERKTNMEFHTTPTAFGRIGGACLPEKARIGDRVLSEAGSRSVFPFPLTDRGKTPDVVYELVPDPDAKDPLTAAIRAFLGKENQPDTLVAGIARMMRETGFNYSVSVAGSPATGLVLKIYRVGAKNRAKSGAREW